MQRFGEAEVSAVDAAEKARGHLAHVIQIDVRWGDMDALGHVNNAVYFRYMEQARIEFFAANGSAATGKGQGMILVHAECNFRRPVVYPARVELRLYCGEPRRSSVPLFIEIVDARRPGMLYADGGSIMAWIDFDANESRPMPDAIRAQLAAAAPK
jgi:acyl-CoA thioester hydrolase